MNGRADAPDETLELPEPARTLFRKTRPALETHVAAYAADGEGYKLGGGTILAARWKHRRSNDIDVLFHPDTKTSHFEAELGKALQQAGGVPLGWGEWSRIEFGETHLDLLKGEPTPAIGHKPASIDGSPVTVLTNVQILNGKLRYRALDPPTRDVYDVAVCGIEDPESLEIVLNGVYQSKLDATVLGWKMSEGKHAENAAEQILDTPARLEPVRKNPAQYAIREAENALYSRVVVACERGRAHVRTACADKERTRTYAGIGELERGFEITGINHFLRAQGENAEQTRARTASAMASRQTTIVFEIEPRLPRKRAVELEPIPPGSSSGPPPIPIV